MVRRRMAARFMATTHARDRLVVGDDLHRRISYVQSIGAFMFTGDISLGMLFASIVAIGLWAVVMVLGVVLFTVLIQRRKK